MPWPVGVLQAAIKRRKHMAYEGAKQFTENQPLGCANGKVAGGPLL